MQSSSIIYPESANTETPAACFLKSKPRSKLNGTTELNDC
jgi:hypothetical protein